MRNCLGQQLAYTNIPTAIAMLVSNFRMELSEEVRLPAVSLECLSTPAIASTCMRGCCSMAMGLLTGLWHCHMCKFLLTVHTQLSCGMRVGMSSGEQDAKKDIKDLGLSKGTLQPVNGIHVRCTPR